MFVATTICMHERLSKVATDLRRYISMAESQWVSLHEEPRAPPYYSGTSLEGSGTGGVAWLITLGQSYERVQMRLETECFRSVNF